MKTDTSMAPADYPVCAGLLFVEIYHYGSTVSPFPLIYDVPKEKSLDKSFCQAFLDDWCVFLYKSPLNQTRSKPRCDH